MQPEKIVSHAEGSPEPRIRIFPTGIIAPEVMCTMTRDEAYWLFYFQARDIAARGKLIDLAEEQYECGENYGCASLMNASLYLRDRAWYQENVPLMVKPKVPCFIVHPDDAEGFGLQGGAK